MSTAKKQNMLIAQSGGPSMVINQSLIGAVIEAKKQPSIGRIFGSLHGIQGILEEDLIDLRKESASTLEAVAATPENALSGDYPMSRYLYVYVNKKPDQSLSPIEHEFLKLVLSKQGQEVVQKDGYIPISAQVAVVERNKLI